MNCFRDSRHLFLGVLTLSIGIGAFSQPSQADPSKYPQFAQQALPANVKPAFISIDELFNEISAETRPLIIDVRPAEEYRTAHILGAVSAPLAEFHAYLKDIPKDRLVVLY